MQTLACFGSFLIVASLSGTLRAQSARLVTDLSTTPWESAYTSYPEEGASLDGVAYFAAMHSTDGFELFRSDGTLLGTTVVADIYPGVGGSGPDRLTAALGKLFFTAEDGFRGRQPWISDGTAEGTRMLARCIPQERPATLDSFSAFFEIGSDVYFYTRDSVGSTVRFWKTDGTPEGTVMIHSWPGYSLGLSIAAFQGRIYFAGSLHGDVELWSTDGTSEGTRQVADIVAGPQSSWPMEVVALEECIVCAAQHETLGTQIYTFDGFRVQRVSQMYDWYGATKLTRVGSRVAFKARGQPWITDGTPEGTLQLTQIGSFSATAMDYYETFTRSGDKLYFGASEPAFGRQLWETDGTPGGTRMFAPLGPPSFSTVIGAMASFGQSLYVYVNGAAQFCRTDGTPAGTNFFQPPIIYSGCCGGSPTTMTFAGGNLFFAAALPELDREVWVGRPDLTAQPLDLIPRMGSSRPHKQTTLGDRLAFVATGDGGPGTTVHGPYISDGTGPGTFHIIPSGYNALSTGSLCAHGSQLFMTGCVGNESSILWVYDGTTSTARRVIPSGIHPPLFTDPRSLAPFGNQLFFLGQKFSSWELFRTDGTYAGTAAVRPGLIVMDYVVASDRMYLKAYTPEYGYEPWVSDGTTAGTRLIADLRPGTASGPMDSLTPSGSSVFFTLGTLDHGMELWFSDGTVNGTRMVRDFTPGPADSLFRAMAAVGNKLVFLVNDFDGHARLWRSDGTEQGTVPLADVRVPAMNGWSNDWKLVSAGGKAWFVASSPETGWELWVSDLTPSGTRMVRDLNPGPASAFGFDCELSIVGHGNSVYFNATDGQSGQEVWASDGTPEGTRLVADINPGPRGSRASRFHVVGNQLYLGAWGAEAAYEPWIIDLPVPCYANCDASTTPPLLTGGDFQCFLNRFASEDPYANCDGSTLHPTLTPNDFQCFINHFAAGCP
jgi:ELWxxDGT repeat protein